MDHNRGLFIALAGVLVGVGMLMVHSASITSRPTEFEQIYLSRHALFLLLGTVLAAVCACLPARYWIRLAPAVYAGCVLLLILVLVPGIGTRVNGAQRWLRYGPMSLQPSELAKIALPLLIARWFAKRSSGRERRMFAEFAVVVPLALVLGLVIVEPDLGSSAFLATGAGIALFVGGWPIRNFAIAGVMALPAMGYMISQRSYQIERITGFVAAWTDPQQAPYQIKQSLVTLGAGGMMGVGIGKGWQKLSFLPEANTDFVFAVAGEELGLLGTLGLVVLWIGLYVAGLRLLTRIDRNSFAFIAGFTLLTQLVLQAALNVAVVTAMVPSKGIPHPLISYGGSNLVTSLLSLGIILSLVGSGSRQRKPAKGAN